MPSKDEVAIELINHHFEVELLKHSLVLLPEGWNLVKAELFERTQLRRTTVDELGSETQVCPA